MTSLTNKRILLGISGGIAAYKCATLIRLLRQAGATVQVVMTEAAKSFITPLTVQALSGRPARGDLFDPTAEGAMSHIELARWADCIVIAPATADCIARLAQGRAEDLLSTLCLATTAPVIIAPAMNPRMWHAAATQRNLQNLSEGSVIIAGPEHGEQACGEVGLGRMIEPDALLPMIAQLFDQGALSGLRVLMTAGPTRELIDPCRYISNCSTGKMGYAIAQAAVEASAAVTLVSGPVNLPVPDRVNSVSVTSALDMYEAVMQRVDECDIFIACAAVSDYRLEKISKQKIKKHDDSLQLVLVRTPDILATVAKRSANRPYCIGFAAESENVLVNARTKLEKKCLDAILANPISDNRVGFESDDNKLWLLTADDQVSWPVQSKVQCARQLIEWIGQHYANATSKTAGSSDRQRNSTPEICD